MTPFHTVAQPQGDTILGLVEIPRLFGSTGEGPPGQTHASSSASAAKKLEPVKLFAEPSEKAKVTTQAATGEMVEAREHGYEEMSAVVYGRRDGWYQIKAKKVNGWLAPKDAGRFRSYEELIKESMAYTNANWDGKLYVAPDKSKKFETIAAKAEAADGSTRDTAKADVEFFGSKSVDGKLWFQIRLIHGRCEDDKPGKEGWVPAYNDRGQLNFWFYSRGC